jgi:hypothetical protein
VADRPAGPLRRLAGDGDDLDDLLGGEGGRAAGARGVIEGLLNQGQQPAVGGLLLLGTQEGGGGGEPAVAPVADGQPG